MKRDKRGLASMLGAVCARKLTKTETTSGGADSKGNNVVVEISSESSEEESEIDEAAQEAERRQILLEYAEYLGLNIFKHHSLLWIAVEALSCPLPDGWKEYLDGDGNVVRTGAQPEPLIQSIASDLITGDACFVVYASSFSSKQMRQPQRSEESLRVPAASPTR
jgi:hypothetical protein